MGLTVKKSDKKDLYDAVKKDTSELEVLTKAVEEFNELQYELSHAVVKMLHGNMIDDDHKKRIISEIADVINTLEQQTDDMSIYDQVGDEINRKLDRLETMKKEGKLSKGIYAKNN